MIVDLLVGCFAVAVAVAVTAASSFQLLLLSSFTFALFLCPPQVPRQQQKFITSKCHVIVEISNKSAIYKLFECAIIVAKPQLLFESRMSESYMSHFGESLSFVVFQVCVFSNDYDVPSGSRRFISTNN